MADKTIRAPITVHNGVQYVAPGTEITLPERDADALIARFGEYGGPAGYINDPANTNVLNAMDAASIESLNVAAEINGGHGKSANRLGQTPGESVPLLRPGAADRLEAGKPMPEKEQLPALPSDGDLHRMPKDELEAMAESRGVKLTDGDTKAEIIAKMKAAA